MPVDFRISDLPTSIPFNNLDLMEVSQVDSESPSGYSSVKKTIEEIGEKLNNDIQYASALATTAKKIIPAINEVNGKGLANLSDTNISTPTANQILAWDGSKWINVTEYGTTFNISSGENVTIKSYIDTRNNYFINEHEVGLWIDNKKIYRCVFTGFNISSVANTWVETTVNASNISTLVNGRILDSSGQSFACSLGYSNNKVAINMPIARSNLTTLILDYTKT